MVLPKFISEVLRQSNPRATINTSETSRSQSPWHSTRQRSASVKRKSDDATTAGTESTASFASIVTGNKPQYKPTIDPALEASFKGALNTAKENIATMRAGIEEISTPESAMILINKLFDTLNILTQSQESMLSFIKESTACPEATDIEQMSGCDNPDMVVLGTVPKKQRFQPAANRHSQPIPNPTLARGNGPPQGSSAPPPETEAEKKIKKFKKAVEEAERSTLILNLNLGKTKIINEDTISTNVSLALTNMAAAVGNQQNGVPTPEAVEKLDDIISVAKSMKFYGKVTRSVRNKKDSSVNGSYCTIPVKYEFRDLGTKIYAEEVFRTTCKAQCSTPYPTILREAIRQIIDDLKEDHPNDLIRVRIDTQKMCFKMARKPKNGSWILIAKTIPIPDDCLDVDSRTIPENFRISWPSSPTRQSRRDAHDGDTTLSTSSGGSQNGPP